jgi:putative tricarboxylic transport membrane protein
LRGEVGAGLVCAAFGAVWIATALGLPYMGEFAPASGFLPLWLGVCLLVLSVGHVVLCLRAPAASLPTGRWRKVAAVALGLVVCVAVVEPLGFAVAVGTYLVFLLRVVEREPWPISLAVSVGAVAGLFAIFHAWLHVPLPKGPWGF